MVTDRVYRVSRVEDRESNREKGSMEDRVDYRV